MSSRLRRRKYRLNAAFSIIWVVPVIALLIGGWLAFKAWSEKGPEITITFESAEGLEANKTKIKFKDVEIGTVTEITLNKKDLSGVVVKAEMSRDSESYLTDKTEFWVVRARVAAGEVSGLGTLFSGAYIGINPSKEGKQARQFHRPGKTPYCDDRLAWPPFYPRIGNARLFGCWSPGLLPWH